MPHSEEGPGLGSGDRTIKDLPSLKAAKLKYLKLYEEISQVIPKIENAHLRANLLHTHSKLGIFLEAGLGYKLWRGLTE